MYYALIRNSQVESIIVADDSFVETIKPEWDEIVKIENYETSGIGPGTKYENSQFVFPVVEVVPEETL